MILKTKRGSEKSVGVLRIGGGDPKHGKALLEFEKCSPHRIGGGDLKKNDISNIIIPEKENDIGERLILFPKHLNAQLDDNNVK